MRHLERLRPGRSVTKAGVTRSHVRVVSGAGRRHVSVRSCRRVCSDCANTRFLRLHGNRHLGFQDPWPNPSQTHHPRWNRPGILKTGVSPSLWAHCRAGKSGSSPDRRRSERHRSRKRIAPRRYDRRVNGMYPGIDPPYHHMNLPLHHVRDESNTSAALLIFLSPVTRGFSIVS